MALPVRIRREQNSGGPFAALARNDFGNVLSRFLGAGLFDDSDDDNALAPISRYGVDIREDADHIYVDAELPGFRKEDVQVQLENGTLTILAEHQEDLTEPAPQAQQGAQGQTAARDAQGAQGQQGPQGQQGTAQSFEQGRSGQQGQQGRQAQQQQQQREQKGNFLLRERRIQRYVRSFTLPPNVDERNVEARLENGMLHVTLNKREDSKPKRVNVS